VKRPADKVGTHLIAFSGQFRPHIFLEAEAAAHPQSAIDFQVVLLSLEFSGKEPFGCF
jgi:hypothetical protein